MQDIFTDGHAEAERHRIHRRTVQRTYKEYLQPPRIEESPFDPEMHGVVVEAFLFYHFVHSILPCFPRLIAPFPIEQPQLHSSNSCPARVRLASRDSLSALMLFASPRSPCYRASLDRPDCTCAYAYAYTIFYRETLTAMRKTRIVDSDAEIFKLRHPEGKLTTSIACTAVPNAANRKPSRCTRDVQSKREKGDLNACE